MHEMPAVVRLLEMTGEKAKENGLSKVTSIEVQLSELSDLEESCLLLYFEIAAEGTICEGADLHFTRQRARLRCNSCGTIFPHERSFTCPGCGGQGMLVREERPGGWSGFTLLRITGEEEE